MHACSSMYMVVKNQTGRAWEEDMLLYALTSLCICIYRKGRKEAGGLLWRADIEKHGCRVEEEKKAMALLLSSDSLSMPANMARHFFLL